MTKTTTLSFVLTAKEILNSNSMPSHFIQKGKMVAHLREKAAQAALALHPSDTQPIVEERLEQLREANSLMILKKRFKKRLDSSLTKEEIEAIMLEEFPFVEVVTKEIEPLFTHFKIETIVYPPSRRRLDPPNLWPTVKALTDGATDAVAWPDDDFAHLLETSFRYGGLSGNKEWRLDLIVTEVEDLSPYQLEAELSS